MAGAARAVKTIGVPLDQRADAVDDVGLAGKGAAVARQHIDERPAVHGAGVRCRVSGVRERS